MDLKDLNEFHQGIKVHALARMSSHASAGLRGKRSDAVGGMFETLRLWQIVQKKAMNPKRLTLQNVT